MRALSLQEAVKQKGMECLAAEHDKSLMRALADAMSTVAEQTWDSKDKWLGILESMHKFITSGDPHLIEAALMLFTKLTTWLLADDPVMMNMQRQMYDILLQFLTAAPNDDVRIAACQASTSFIAVRCFPPYCATHAAYLSIAARLRACPACPCIRLQCGCTKLLFVLPPGEPHPKGAALRCAYARLHSLHACRALRTRTRCAR